MITTDEGYKIPELGDKDFWDSFVFNWNRSTGHIHDGVDSALLSTSSFTQDANNRLVTDAQITIWDTHTHDGGDTPPILLAGQTQDASNRLVTDAEKLIWNTHTHDGGDTPPILLADQTQDSNNRLVSDAQIGIWFNHVHDGVSTSQLQLSDQIQDSSNRLVTDAQIAIWDTVTSKIDTSLKGSINGVAELDGGGKVPPTQLPAYVDDVLEYPNEASFPVTGESGKIYIAIDINISFRWTGTQYTSLVGTVGLGETSTTAYRGDRGKIGYDHTFITTGNPHSVNQTDVGLGSIDNTADVDKPVSTAQQTALDLKADKLTVADHDDLSLTGIISGQGLTWDGAGLVPTSLALLGETSTTAHRGDHGKIGYDHTFITTGNPHSVLKSDIGLGSVDNTADINKPVSINQQSALDAKADVVTVGSHTDVDLTGIALDEGLKWDGLKLVRTPLVVLGSTASTAYRGDRGTVAYDHTLLSNNPHVVTKAQLSLGSVDNTSDADKPVSTAQQTALDLKANKATVGDHTDVDLTGIVLDEGLKWDGTKFVATSLTGGQNTYDAIVDAAGGGDYTSIRTAIQTEPEGATIFIKDGAYSESLFTEVTPGQKIVGESRDGVVLTSSVTAWGVFRFSFGTYRGGSERDTANSAWTANSIGLIDAVNGSSVLTYSGSTNPVAGDLIHVEPNFYALIDSVDTGPKEITMDRSWGNPTATGLDCIVIDIVLTDTEVRTEMSNMTIVIDDASGAHAFRTQNSVYNYHLKNVKIRMENCAAGQFAFFLFTAVRCSFDDLEIDGGDISNTKAYLLQNGVVDVHVRNLVAYNIPDIAIQLSSGVRATRRSTLHFKSLSCTLDAIGNVDYVYRCLIQIDNILARRISSTGSNVAYFESKIEVKRAVLTDSGTVIDASKCIIIFNYVDNNIDIRNSGSALYNIITDSYFDSTLTVDTEAVISGSVAYDALTGTPAQNNGILF